MSTIILRTVTRLAVPIVFITSFALFLQGHNLPGGGFIAGVLTATGLALVYIAYGLDFLEETVFRRSIGGSVEHLQHGLVSDYRRLFAVGLAIAAGSGLVFIALGMPFMSYGYTYGSFPLYDHIELASAVVFDFGVYCVVVGSLLTVLSVVGEE
ncbi:MnhB domain-containing protein [Salarchaeum sp. III]|uniref:MnhB domain-containing protein n=1 Tax=Salarchaeum sp. III TaxID=3107927 RepID=UPI002ED98CF5